MPDAAQQEMPPPRPAAAAQACRFGGFAFDLVRGVLRRPDGAEAVLRPKAAGLLHHLARHAGEVVGREALLDAVWPDVCVTDDSITQCVTEIRRALGAEGAPLLRTLPKRGYLLDAAVTPDAARAAAAAPPAADAAALGRQPVAWLGAGLGMAALAGIVAWSGGMPQAVPSAPAEALASPAWSGAGPATGPVARRRSILVLPFAGSGGEGASGAAVQAALADAMSEHLITSLTSLPGFVVIGRGTAFANRGRDLDVLRLGRELDLRYVLGGRVRRSGAQLDISLHLQDTASGGELWADRFTLPADDPGAVPRLVFARIQRPLFRRLDMIENQRSLGARPGELDAVDFVRRGNTLWTNVTSLETIEAAKAQYAQAVALDDASSAAHAGLAGVHLTAASQGYSLDRDADLSIGERHLARALALDPTDTQARFWRGLALERRWRFDEALAEYDLMIALNTNVARAMGARGMVMLETDRLEEAIAASREALRISPLDGGRATWTWQIAVATRRLGREEDALPHFIRAASLRPLHEGFWANLVASYALVGRQAEAVATLREGLARWPGLTIAHFRRRAGDWSPYPGYQAGYERYLEGLRLAGMPEE